MAIVAYLGSVQMHYCQADRHLTGESVQLDQRQSHFEFTKKFPDKNSAIDFIVATKYKDGYACPKCGCMHKGIYHQKYNHRFMYCNNCKSEFSTLKGTIFENTHLDLWMWLYAMNLAIIFRKGISALQLKRDLGMGLITVK